MKLAIMQPYLFPYIGYFQLIHAVDAFVVYDDVNYIKGGWINRNYILSQGHKALITLQLQGASPNKLINQISVTGQRAKMLRSIAQSYAKAPHFNSVIPLIEDIIMYEEHNLAKFVSNSLVKISNYLGLKPKWQLSSDVTKNNDLRGQNKVLEICRALGADHYVNSPGGRELYDAGSFKDNGMKLSFIHSHAKKYSQRSEEFISNLSIIDVLMSNGLDQCSVLLQAYKLEQAV